MTKDYGQDSNDAFNALIYCIKQNLFREHFSTLVWNFFREETIGLDFLGPRHLLSLRSLL